jgi:hypothetical protein
MCYWLYMGFGLNTEFTECLLYVTTNRYSTFTNLHALEITKAQCKISQFIYSYTCSLVVVSNNGDSFCCSHAHWLTVNQWFLTDGTEQSSNLLLAFVSTVTLCFGLCQNPLPYFCSFQDYLWVFKWGLLLDERRGLTTTVPLWLPYQLVR